jgi:acetoacetyl-CoA synthetase
VLLAVDRYTYAGRDFDTRRRVSEIARRLPSLRTVIVRSGPPVSSRPSDLDLDLDSRLTVFDYDSVVAGTHRLQTVECGFNAPGSVLFSSGTTGRPKCIVHRAGGVLLKHLSEMLLHCDIRPHDRLFYYTTPSWMMWNWLVSGLAAGACIVLYSGAPAAPDALQLLEMAEREGVTYFGTSPGYIDTVRRNVGGEPAAVRQRFDLSSLRTVGSTGAPLSPTTARFAASWGFDLQVLSKSGGTDLCGGLVSGDPTRPVWAGEIQAPAYGCAIAIVDDDGNDVPPGVRGELVSRTAFPSMPLGFLGDDSRAVLRRTYFERFPGCWHQSDFARQTDHGGYVIEGRSDTTLNVHGVRIGTAEIYAQLDRFPWIQAAAAVEQRSAEASRLVLLLELAADEELTDDERGEISAALREHCSPRHVPAVIHQVAQLPRTMNGKVSEVAASDAINGFEVRGSDTLANAHVLADLRRALMSE